ncbi:TIGR04283 family arsenosugar biosynthesis glycosyltransferase [Marinobacterium sp. YM272]|uniref:TIGR04283 family arsenosugar biosynthesis glycosyltransferase n=1 Tax=Marinobacterium sp. YM272 TaxID=3421654 RepID=UPI003D7F38BB
MGISVIVPVLNEAQQMPGLLAHLKQLEQRGAEILIVDGGSDDGSADLARAANFEVIEAPRGRASQMNAGAGAAAEQLLLFLHADTRLADDGLEQLGRLQQSSSDCWGRFDVCIDGRHRMLGVIAAMMNLRSRLTGIATGDQGIFITRELFERAGRFPNQPLMEDVEISKRLRRLQPPVCLKGPVHTSGRRWESRGVWRTILLMWRLRLAYWWGANAQTLARRYQ